jgi:hypothetical protein
MNNKMFYLETENRPTVYGIAMTLMFFIPFCLDYFPEAKLMNEVQLKLKKMQTDCDKDVRAFAREVKVDKLY